MKTSPGGRRRSSPSTSGHGVTGYLEQVRFKDGDEVKEGDLLFEIDPRPYQAELARTEATDPPRRAHLNRLDADLLVASRTSSTGETSAAKSMTNSSATGPRAMAMLGVAMSGRDLAKLNVEFTKIKAPDLRPAESPDGRPGKFGEGR